MRRSTPLDLLDLAARRLLRHSTVPRDLASVTSFGEERPDAVDGGVDTLWESIEALYRTGVYPAVQVCVRHRGEVVLNRAIGHASGNGPNDPGHVPPVLASVETPFCLYSASKAITAMVVHKLDEQRVLHLEDRVADYIPEFARHSKQHITLRHLLSHRAGIPNLPSEALDLDLLENPDHIRALLCDARPASRPGRLLSYHAISGGFVLAEVVRAATGEGIERVLEREICEPLGFRWMRYGVAEEDIPLVAVDAMTGPRLFPPISTLLQRALGMDLEDAVRLARDPRFFSGVIPSANIVSTASELCSFFECLRAGGELDGVRVFAPRTVRHATGEQSYREIDLTLGIPIRYGLGMMLGDRPIGLFGPDTPRAFGHLGLTNILGWADPDRAISAAVLTSGKPVLSTHAIRLVRMLGAFAETFPIRSVRSASRAAGHTADRAAAAS